MGDELYLEVDGERFSGELRLVGPVKEKSCDSGKRFYFEVGRISTYGSIGHVEDEFGYHTDYDVYEYGLKFLGVDIERNEGSHRGYLYLDDYCWGGKPIKVLDTSELLEATEEAMRLIQAKREKVMRNIRGGNLHANLYDGDSARLVDLVEMGMEDFEF